MFYNQTPQNKSEFCVNMFLCSISCFILTIISPVIPFHNNEEKQIMFYISLVFGIFFFIQFLCSILQIKYIHMIDNSKPTKEKVISVIKSHNSIAEFGYEDGILSHLSCEIEIDGTEIIVEFAVPSNQLDISTTKHFDATKLTDYITEFS